MTVLENLIKTVVDTERSRKISLNSALVNQSKQDKEELLPEIEIEIEYPSRSQPVYLIVASPQQIEMRHLFDDLLNREIDVYFDDTIGFGCPVNRYHGTTRSFILRVKPDVIYCSDWVSDVVKKIVESLNLSDRIKISKPIKP